MKRLGIFGGTFNPIHLGHLNLVRSAARELSLDRVLLIPTYTPPHKAAPELADGEHRLNMCRLAVQDDPLLEVSDLELRRGGASYTYLTLEELHQTYPDARLFFIVGGDMLLSFRRWKRWRRILELATLCAAARTPQERAVLRPEAERLAGVGYGCRVLDTPILEMSSTDIRRRVKEGGDTAELLAPQTACYIADHGLYK